MPEQQLALEKWLSVKAGKPRTNLIGQRFGKLVVIDFFGGRRWKLKCDCGRIYDAATHNFKRQRSCGCVPADNSKPGTALRAAYGAYRLNAAKRNKFFDLTLDQFHEITSASCYYCGAAPDKIRTATSGETYSYSGIDRKDNDLGYTIENSLPCCFFCNSAKRNKSHDDFLKWIETVHLRRGLSCHS